MPTRPVHPIIPFPVLNLLQPLGIHSSKWEFLLNILVRHKNKTTPEYEQLFLKHKSLNNSCVNLKTNTSSILPPILPIFGRKDLLHVNGRRSANAVCERWLSESDIYPVSWTLFVYFSTLSHHKKLPKNRERAIIAAPSIASLKWQNI